MKENSLVELISPIEKDKNLQLKIPNNYTQVKNNTYYNDIIVLNDIPVFDIQDYDISNDKEFVKYIEDIKKVIRSSYEYRQFVNYLRDNMNMNACSFFKNVSNSNTFKIRIELHHSPYTLQDIVMTVFNKRVFYNESLEIEMVAKEVMYIHYFLMVGIIPLAETVHELVHKQLIFIPLDKVLGNYEAFEEMYGEWIPPETVDKIDMMRTKTLAYNDALEMSILQQNPIVLQLPGDTGQGLYNLPTMKDIEAVMANRIMEIKQNHYKLPVKEPLT